MNESTVNKALMVLCLILSVTSICSVAYIATSDSPDDNPYDDVKHIMYLGMADRPEAEINEIENRTIELITGYGYGYTLEHETGGYVDENGNAVRDGMSLKFVVDGAEYENIRTVIQTIKGEYGIPAVYLEREAVTCSFE